MKKTDTQETMHEDQAAPPLFGSWRRVYWFVALFFVVEVALFYVFTQHFNS